MAHTRPQSEDQFIAQAVNLAFQVNKQLVDAGRQDECLMSLAELAIFVNSKAQKASRPSPFSVEQILDDTDVVLSARFAALPGIDTATLSWLESLRQATSSLDDSRRTLDRTGETALSDVMRDVAAWDGEGNIPQGLLRRRDTDTRRLLDISAMTGDTGADVSINMSGAGAGVGGEGDESKSGPELIEPVTWHALAITLYERREQLGIVDFQTLADAVFALLEPTKVTELFNWVDGEDGGDEYDALPSHEFVAKLQKSLLKTPLLGDAQHEQRRTISEWLGGFSAFPIGDLPSELHDGPPAAPTPSRRVRVRKGLSRGGVPPRTRSGSAHPRSTRSTPEQMALAVSTNPKDPLRKLLSQESPGPYPGALSVLLSLPVTLNQANNRTGLKWYIDTYVGSMMRAGVSNRLTSSQLVHLALSVQQSDAQWRHLTQAVQAGSKTLLPLKAGEERVLSVAGARAPLCAYIQISQQDRWRKWGAVIAFGLVGGTIALITRVFLPKASSHFGDVGPWSPLDALILLLFNAAGLPLGEAGEILFAEFSQMHGLQRVLQRYFSLTDGAAPATDATSRGLQIYNVISHPLTHFALVTAFNLMVSLNWATHGGTDSSKHNIHKGIEAAWSIATGSMILTALTWGGLRSQTRQTSDSAVAGYFKGVGDGICHVGRGVLSVATSIWNAGRSRCCCAAARTTGTGGGGGGYTPMTEDP